MFVISFMKDSFIQYSGIPVFRTSKKMKIGSRNWEFEKSRPRSRGLLTVTGILVFNLLRSKSQSWFELSRCSGSRDSAVVLN